MTTREKTSSSSSSEPSGLPASPQARLLAHQRVVRIDQSPMNERIWVLQLACGHDVCITQKKRPSNLRTWTDKTTGERLCGPRLMECDRCHTK